MSDWAGGAYIAEEVAPWIDASGNLVAATGGAAVGTPAPGTPDTPAGPPGGGGQAKLHPLQPTHHARRQLSGRNGRYAAARAFDAGTSWSGNLQLLGLSRAKLTPLPSQARVLTPARAARAERLTTAQRNRIFEQFFSAHPGGGGGRYGYGRGAVDFLKWEEASHRIANRGGSAWWKTVNGMMALDLQAAQRDIRTHQAGQTVAIADWIRYASSRASGSARERLFWQAHQESLHEGVAFAAPQEALLPVHEQALAQLAVDLVDLSAIGNKATNTGSIRAFTDAGYPKQYPASSTDVRVLTQGAEFGMAYGQLPTAGNIGISSSRWPWWYPRGLQL
jgi:hypothetical protein